MGFDFLIHYCERNPYCLNLSLQYYSNYVVYDPTAFIVCKLVIVAWLIAYGATTKPRAPVEQLPHGDAARHALVSRLLTKYLYQLHRRNAFATNNFLENVPVFKREIHYRLVT